MIPETIKSGTPWVVLAVSAVESFDTAFKLAQFATLLLAIALSIQSFISRSRRMRRETSLSDVAAIAKAQCEIAGKGECPIQAQLTKMEKV